ARLAIRPNPEGRPGAPLALDGDDLAAERLEIDGAALDLPLARRDGLVIEAGDVAGTSRHYAVWHDPHPKPSYLFALVGGDLAVLRDTFTTMSGKAVALGI